MVEYNGIHIHENPRLDPPINFIARGNHTAKTYTMARGADDLDAAIEELSTVHDDEVQNFELGSDAFKVLSELLAESEAEAQPVPREPYIPRRKYSEVRKEVDWNGGDRA